MSAMHEEVAATSPAAPATAQAAQEAPGAASSPLVWSDDDLVGFLSHERPRVRGWALARLENPARARGDAAVLQALIARIEREEEPGLVADATEAAGARGAVEAIPAIVARLASPDRDETYDDSHCDALARLGARQPAAVAAVREAFLAAEGGLLPSWLAVGGAEAVADGVDALIDAAWSDEREEAARVVEHLARAGRLCAARQAVEALLDGRPATEGAQALVPADAAAHWGRRSYPKLLRVAVHALRPLADAAPDAAAGAASSDVEALRRFAGALAREALAGRDELHDLRGELARSVAVLLLAARSAAIAGGPIDAPVSEANVKNQHHREASQAGAVTEGSGRPARLGALAASFSPLASLLSTAMTGRAWDRAMYEQVARGDAAIPGLRERIQVGDDGSLAVALTVAGEIGSEAAADLVLAHAERALNEIPPIALDAIEALGSPRLIATLARRAGKGDRAADEAFLLLCDLSGKDHPRLGEIRRAVEARSAAESAGLGAEGTILDAIQRIEEGSPARLALRLRCRDCGAVAVSLVERAVLDPGKADETPVLHVLDRTVCDACEAVDREEAHRDARLTALLFVEAVGATSELLDRSVHLFPLRICALRQTGRTERTMCLKDDLAALRARVDADPRDVEALIACGNMLRTLGRFDEALTLFARAADVQPDAVEARAALIDGAIDARDEEGARDHGRRGLETIRAGRERCFRGGDLANEQFAALFEDAAYAAHALIERSAGAPARWTSGLSGAWPESRRR